MKFANIKYILLTSMVLLSLLLAIIPSNKVNADVLSSVKISAPAYIPLGGTFTARINITAGATFNSFQTQIDYNSSIIEVIGSEGGTTGVTAGLVGTTSIPIDMWSFYPTGQGGSVRILGRIPGNQEVYGSGYLAEIHFQVVGTVGQSTDIQPGGTTNFSNGLFDAIGRKISSVTPWNGTTVQVHLPLQINTTSLSPASVESNYSYTMNVTGGSPPYFWSVVGLPGGLSCSSGGIISGKPTQSGDFNLQFSVTDSAISPAIALSGFVLHVYPALKILTGSLPEGVQGKNYSYILNTTEAAAPLNWSATGLPSGLSMTNSGMLNGIPLVSGDYNINVTVTDSFSPSHSNLKSIALHIYSGLGIMTTSLPLGSAGSAYNVVVVASGGKAPYSWSASGLPSGLNISTGGTISGIPSSSGNYNLTLSVSDNFTPPNTASQALTLHVNAAPVIETSSLQDGIVGKTYSTVLEGSGGVPPYIWSATGLPSGLNCSETGIVSGNPSSSGQFNVNVTLRDSLSPSNITNKSFTLNIKEGLVITTIKLEDGLIGKSYTGNLTASGSLSPYIWTVNGLPSGLTASNSGVISGIATIAGNFLLNVSVTDSLSPSNTTQSTVSLKIYKVGDANGDGVVSIGDATYVERVILGLSQETPGCDASLNGFVSIGDVTKIERIILGLN